MRPTRIPLFPLEVVLFPGMPLPLHIFEHRYRIMVARCANENLEIGIILTAETGIVKVGCTAEIVEKLKEYPDGRTDILCEGRALFRVVQILNEREYQEAVAEYLVEDVLPQDPEKESHLIERFQVCHALVFGQPLDCLQPRRRDFLGFSNGRPAPAGAGGQTDVARNPGRERAASVSASEN
jgi:Lon protease-like protein